MDGCGRAAAATSISTYVAYVRTSVRTYVRTYACSGSPQLDGNGFPIRWKCVREHNIFARSTSKCGMLRTCACTQKLSPQNH